jgi:D-alanyl-D-alanine carboxypeptidase
VNESAVLERVAAYVHAHRRRLFTPGLALALTDADGPLGVVVDGMADVATGEPVAEHHRFQIGSISKGFTALAVLQQVEAGRLDLDEPVTRILPWFHVPGDFRPITAHHLLSHTAGIVGGTDFTGDAPSEVWALRETAAGSAPGERFRYSNVGYKTLGLMLEALTGEPWWDTVRDRVMEPIGMGDADVIITDGIRSRLATGHRSPFDDRPWLERHGWEASPWFRSATADGTICATAVELTAYARLLLRRGDPVVSPESFARMTTAVAESPGQPGHRYAYGLKWIEEAGRPSVLGHSGGMLGFSAYLLIDPEAGFGAAVLMNSLYGDALVLARFALECASAAARGDEPPEVPTAHDPTWVEHPERYVGVFEDEAGRVTIEPSGSGLAIVTDASSSALEPLAQDLFGVDADDDDGALHPVLVEGEGPAKVLTWGSRELRPPGIAAPTPSRDLDAALVRGRYASWNPWVPGFRIFDRPSGLWLSFTGEAADVEPEGRLERLDDGLFRVGDRWSPDRVRFDMVVDGRSQRAVFDGAPFYRTFTP